MGAEAPAWRFYDPVSHLQYSYDETSDQIVFENGVRTPRAPNVSKQDLMAAGAQTHFNIPNAPRILPLHGLSVTSNMNLPFSNTSEPPSRIPSSRSNDSGYSSYSDHSPQSSAQAYPTTVQAFSIVYPTRCPQGLAVLSDTGSKILSSYKAPRTFVREPIMNTPIYSDFKRRAKSKKFFTIGKVFLTLWSEPAGELQDSSGDSDGISSGKFGELVFSKVQRFVVIREANDACCVLPIRTYAHQGVGKKGVQKSDHCIIHTGIHPPELLPSEIPSKGESGVLFPALRVDPDDPGSKLDLLSRLDYASLYTVNHRLKVKSFGRIHRDSMVSFLSHFQKQWHREISDPIMLTLPSRGVSNAEAQDPWKEASEPARSQPLGTQSQNKSEEQHQVEKPEQGRSSILDPDKRSERTSAGSFPSASVLMSSRDSSLHDTDRNLSTNADPYELQSRPDQNVRRDNPARNDHELDEKSVLHPPTDTSMTLSSIDIVQIPSLEQWSDEALALLKRALDEEIRRRMQRERCSDQADQESGSEKGVQLQEPLDSTRPFEEIDAIDVEEIGSTMIEVNSLSTGQQHSCYRNRHKLWDFRLIFSPNIRLIRRRSSQKLAMLWKKVQRAANKVQGSIDIAMAPRVMNGAQRIYWTCTCGRPMYDDFVELKPGALRALEISLNDSNVSTVEPSGTHGKVGAEDASALTTWTSQFVQYLNSTTAEAAAVSCADDPNKRTDSEASFTGKPVDSRSSSQPSMNEGILVSEPSRHSVSRQWLDAYLLLCIPFRRYATKLVNIETGELQSDVDFFTRLRTQYSSSRGCLRKWFSLKCLSSIRFAQFEVYDNDLADVHRLDVIPPASLSKQYTYCPMPAEFTPPIGQNLLRHLYEHPEEAKNMPVCFSKVPKKLQDRLVACPAKGSSSGFGLCIIDGLSRPKIVLCSFISLILSSAFGIAWSVMRSSVQGGFAVACFILAALATLITLIQTMVEV